MNNMATVAELTREELLAKIASLESTVKANAVKEILSGNSIKTTEKGALSFYGNGRFPVTQYVTGWIRIFKAVDLFRKHIVADFGRMSFRTDEQRLAACEYLGLPLDSKAVIAE